MTDALDLPAVRAARQARKEFLDRLEPLRQDLYAYCRRLTGNAFDAEDLVQESLARAFNQAAQANAPIERPRAWLFRVATRSSPSRLHRLQLIRPSYVMPGGNW